MFFFPVFLFFFMFFAISYKSTANFGKKLRLSKILTEKYAWLEKK